MATLPDHPELQRLQSYHAPCCISLYVPFVSDATSDAPMRITLKNMLRSAEDQLSQAAVSTAVITALTAPAWTLVESNEFMPVRHEGLALLMANGFFRSYRVPVQYAEQSIGIGKRFNLSPLLEAIRHDERYFVLLISHKHVRLHEGDQYSLRQLRLTRMAGGVRETLNIDEFPKARELHPVGSATIYGKASEGYHQQYDVTQTDKEMLLEFFRRVDSYLHPFLVQYDRPLILAGVEYLLPIYRQANTYSRLLPRAITGNLERAPHDTIRHKALQVIANSHDEPKYPATKRRHQSYV